MFEDGTFQGTRVVDRYALANVIARLLEDLEVSRFKGTPGDMQEINELRLRFEEDLATWYADQQSLRDEVKQIDENAIIAEERVSRVVMAQIDLEDQVQEIRDQMTTTQNNLDQVQASISQMQLDMGGLSESELRQAELITAVIQLEKDIAQAEAINSLENWAGERVLSWPHCRPDSQMAEEFEALKRTNQQLKDSKRGRPAAKETQNAWIWPTS